MAVAYVRQQAKGSTLSSPNAGAIMGEPVVAGNLVRAYVLFDNTGTGTPTVTSVTKPANETASWVLIAQHNSSTATSAGGVRGEMWAIRTAVDWADAFLVDATLSATVGRVVIIIDEFSGVTTTLRGTAGTGTNTGGSPSATTAGTAPAIGDLVLGAASFENNAAATADADTLNGPWAGSMTHFTASGGAAGNVSGIIQHKIPTTAGHQTYNPTGASDSGAVIVALVPAVVPLIAGASDSTGLTDAVDVVSIPSGPVLADETDTLSFVDSFSVDLDRTYVDVVSVIDTWSLASTFNLDYTDLAALFDTQEFTSTFDRDYVDLVPLVDGLDVPPQDPVAGIVSVLLDGEWVEKPITVRVNGKWVWKPVKRRVEGEWIRRR